MQAYFDCLTELKERTFQQSKDINDILASVKRQHNVTPTPFYYQIMAKHEAFIEGDKDEAIRYIREGIQKFSHSMYLVRDKFDIYKKYNDIMGMREAIEELNSCVRDLAYKGAYVSRKALLDLYEGKSTNSVCAFLREQGGFSERNISNILKKANKLEI